MDNVQILLVEDNPADVVLTKENFISGKIIVNIDDVSDGVEALSYLKKEGEYTNAPTPDLILLDLNLPKKNGIEVLTEIKADRHLKKIPVVILTSSNAERDIVKTYNLHASSYVMKPVDLAGFTEIVQAIEGFWFKVVKFPKKD